MNFQNKKVGQWILPLVSILLSLFAGEGIIRLLENPLHLKFPGLSRHFAEAIYFRKLPDSQPNPPAIKKFHPRMGWQAWKYRQEETNPQGWRHEKSYSGPKEAIRVVIVGDSFTFGSGVPWTSTLNFHLQERLGPDFEVFNIAAEGFSLDQIAYGSMEEAFLYDPDMVISGFISDDIRRSCLGFGWTHTRKPFYEKVDGDFVLTGVPVPTPAEVRAAAGKGWSPALKSLLASSRVISAFLEPYFSRQLLDCFGERGELLNYVHEKVSQRTRWLGVLVDGKTPREFDERVSTHTPLVIAEKEMARFADQLRIQVGRSDTYHFDSDGNKLLAYVYAEKVLEAFSENRTLGSHSKK